jgi:hypothetical protein
VKNIPKKKAPVQLTAGTGFRNENCVAARFLLDLLAGTDSLGEEFGKIERGQFPIIGVPLAHARRPII